MSLSLTAVSRTLAGPPRGPSAVSTCSSDGLLGPRGGPANGFALFVIAFAVLGALQGCAQYRVGADSLYAPDVQTVYLPMIESESFRRDLGERLTEAVAKQIELKTPFKVVSTPAADSVLSVRVINDTRRVLAEDPFDQPRVLANSISAEVTWVNRRRLPLTPAQSFSIPGGLVNFRETDVFIPASGQSVATSQQKAIEKLAQQIVSAMEEPW